MFFGHFQSDEHFRDNIIKFSFVQSWKTVRIRVGFASQAHLNIPLERWIQSAATSERGKRPRNLAQRITYLSPDPTLKTVVVKKNWHSESKRRNFTKKTWTVQKKIRISWKASTRYVRKRWAFSVKMISSIESIHFSPALEKDSTNPIRMKRWNWKIGN